MSGDDEIAVTTRQSSRLSRRADRVFRPPLFAQGRRRPEAARSAQSSARSRSTRGPTCGAVALLVFYFDSETLEHPIDVERVRRRSRAARITTWEDRSRCPRCRSSGRPKAAACSAATSAPTAAAASIANRRRPRRCRRISQRFEQLEARMEASILPDTAESATLKMFSPMMLELTDTLRTLQNLGLTVRDEMSAAAQPAGRPHGVPQRLRVEARRRSSRR